MSQDKRILIIDDDENFTTTKQVRWESKYGLDLIPIDNWKDGIKKIKEDNFSGIILDVKCKETKDSLPDESIGFQMLVDVLKYLDKIDSDVPVAVWTSYPNQKEIWQKAGILETLPREISPFLKNEDEEKKLVEFLSESSSNSNRNFFYEKYSEIYQILNNNISKDHAESFLGFVMTVDNDVSFKQKEKYTVPRAIFEGILKSLSDKIPYLKREWINTHKSFVEKNGGNPNKINNWVPASAIEWLTKNAKQNEIPFNSLIGSYLNSLRIATNEYSLAHLKNSLEAINIYQPTINSTKALLYMMLEIIVWFNAILEEKRKFTKK